jgi:hypothetical protein
MILAENAKDLTKQTLDIIDICRASQSQRAAAYRIFGQWRETGRAAGPLALANVLWSHLQRTASHLMSPSELRFQIDFEQHYPKDIQDKGAMAARALSREWERKNIDILFGRGVFEALSYGACILKSLSKENGGKHDVGARLVQPWAFAVYNEGVNALSDQEAVMETVYLSKPEVWRRVRNLPDAEKLFRRIIASSTKEAGVGIPTSFMHQVLSTAVLDVSLQNATRPQPGGVVQLTNDPNFATLGPTVAAELFPMHEVWLKDDERHDDWTTVQICEPDILIAPLYKHCNLFAPDTLPYGLIQPNEVTDYFWGRSEITDLMMLQEWLTTHLDDIKRIVGNQADGFYAFPGMDGLLDEEYVKRRSSGFMSMPPGSSAVDLTPKLPPEFVPLIKEILWMMDRVSGFANILSGEGEPGVRAGVHADTLKRMASPHLRDRSLLVERQCAERGDATLAAMEAKDAKVYWANAETKEEGEFLLNSLPDDRRVSVDSHSSSPIYHDDNANLISFGVKAGFITGESAIEDLPFQHKDKLIQRLKEKEKQQQALLESLPPEEKAKVLAGHGGHHR